MIEETKAKLSYFRKLQLWPLANEVDFENWIENFQTDEDKEIAAQILNFFVYFPDNIVNQMLQTVVGHCGYYFSSLDPTWTHDSFKNNCWYSFVKGEGEDDPTDSGYIFTRKLRDELGIPVQRILSFEKLVEKLEENESQPQNVILVDDFVGSGAQTDHTWNNIKCGSNKMTLGELSRNFNHRIVYAPLIVNIKGFNRIKRACNGLHLEYAHLLGYEYSLLNENGLCWQGDSDKYNKFLSLLDKIANKEGIPQEYGGNQNDKWGFAAQGLALAFSHGIPDACPAFFYWNTKTWKPLKKRHYHR